MADNLTTFMCWLSWYLGASTSWNPLDLSRPVMGLLCFYFFGKVHLWRTCDVHSCAAKDPSFAWYDAVQLVSILWLFVGSYFLHVQLCRPSRMTSGLLGSEDEGTVILQTVRNYTPNNTASHPTRLDTSAHILIMHLLLQGEPTEVTKWMLLSTSSWSPTSQASGGLHLLLLKG